MWSVTNIFILTSLISRVLHNAKGTGSIDTIKMQAKWTHSNPGVGREYPHICDK